MHTRLHAYNANKHAQDQEYFSFNQISAFHMVCNPMYLCLFNVKLIFQVRVGS